MSSCCVFPASRRRISKPVLRVLGVQGKLLSPQDPFFDTRLFVCAKNWVLRAQQIPKQAQRTLDRVGFALYEQKLASFANLQADRGRIAFAFSRSSRTPGLTLPGRLSRYCMYSIATGTWYNARVSKSPCEYRNGAETFYFAKLERERDQKELP